MKVKSLSRVQLFVTPWTVAYQDPLSMGFSRQEYWSGLLRLLSNICMCLLGKKKTFNPLKNIKPENLLHTFYRFCGECGV